MFVRLLMNIARNASFSTICTLTRARVGEVLASPEGRAALHDIMTEVLQVARACLPENDLVKAVLHATVAQDIVNNEDPASTFGPSMLIDLEEGRPMEVEATVGSIVRRAKERVVSTPQLTLIYANLKVIQARLIKSQK
jgi:2-dehydropantoate 2-reductase